MKKSTALLSLVLLSATCVVPSVVSATEINQTESIPQVKSEVSQSNLKEEGSLRSNRGYVEVSDPRHSSIQNTTTEKVDTDISKNQEMAVSSTDANITSGTYGTSPYYLTSSGELHFGGGTFRNVGRDDSISDTLGMANSLLVKRIIFDGEVFLSPFSDYLFSRLPNLENIDNLRNVNTSNVTSMNYMFGDDSSLISLDLSNFDTSNVTDMSFMFVRDSNLTSLDLSNFDTSNVTDMNNMFNGDSNLSSLNLSSFDTSKVTNMINMFNENSNLSSLNLSSFDTSNVTKMYQMFNGDSNLSSLNLSSFDTSNVTDMSHMFNGDSNLSSLDLSSFDTSNVTSMIYMFSGDSNLISLDISGFNTSNDTNMLNMFAGNGKLQKIVLGEHFNFQTDVLFPSHNSNSSYTSMWQNVASGTEQNPLGNNVWTAQQLVSNYNGTTDSDTYVWQPQSTQTSEVTAKYVDTEGDKISDDVVKSGNIGDKYTTEQKAIGGYTFKEMGKDSAAGSGNFTDQAQTVTYVYTKNPVAAADVTVKYVDTEGNKISDDVVKSGNIGDKYITDQKAIDGYTFKEMGKDSTGVSGDFTDKAQTVTYVYTKDKVNPKPDDNKPSHKEDTTKTETSSSTHDTLPETGENERMTLMSVGTGLVLLLVVLIASIFRFKRLKSNK